MVDTNTSMAESSSHTGTGIEEYDHASLKESLNSSQVSYTGSNHESQLYTRKSNTSELSKIVSGIRDDITQEGPSQVNPMPESIMIQELDRVSRMSTRQEARDGDDSIEEEAGDDVSEDPNIPPPDKGFAWVIAIIGMLAVVATWGSNASYGVFLAYYIEEDVFEGGTQYDYAMIGGLIICLAQALCPFATLLYRIGGIFFITTMGIILQTLGYVLASFATELWQLYVCQGFIIGLSFSFVFVPATLVLPTWFDKKRAFSFGIAVSGAGLGGILFSLSIHKVFDMTGNQHWGLRLAALLALITALPCFFLRTRTGGELPLKQRLTKQFFMDNVKLIFNFKVMKSTPIMILGFWFSTALFGYAIVLFSLSSYASSVGLSSSQGSALTAIMNAGQVIGRPLCGYLGDRFGRSNFAIICCVFIAILLWAFWINATTYASLIPFSFLIGMVMGVGSLMSSPICSELVIPSDFPAAWSALNIMVGLFALVAELCALHLKQNNAAKPFLPTQIFLGAVFMLAAVIMMFLRPYLVTRAVERRLKASRERLDSLNGCKTRYLVKEQLEKEQQNKEEVDLLYTRIERYELLLRHGTYFYFVRMVYPIRA